MTFDDTCRDETLQYGITRKAAKTSAVLSGKIDKYDTDEEKLPFDSRKVIEQAKFIYSPLGKALEKTKKNN